MADACVARKPTVFLAGGRGGGVPDAKTLGVPQADFRVALSSRRPERRLPEISFPAEGDQSRVICCCGAQPARAVAPESLAVPGGVHFFPRVVADEEGAAGTYQIRVKRNYFSGELVEPVHHAPEPLRLLKFPFWRHCM